MPFKSQAQRRLFYALEAKGKLKKGTTRHWNEETGDRELPERVGTKEAALSAQGIGNTMWRIGQRILNSDRRALWAARGELAREAAQAKVARGSFAALSAAPRIAPLVGHADDLMDLGQTAYHTVTPHIAGVTAALQHLGIFG